VFSVMNGPQFIAGMEAKAAMLSRGLDVAAKKAATDIRRVAHKNTPSVTGALRAGWEGPKEVGRWEYEVLNVTTNQQDFPYGVVVEWGGAKYKVPFSGRFMLTRAIHEIEPILRAAVRAVIAKVCH